MMQSDPLERPEAQAGDRPLEPGPRAVEQYPLQPLAAPQSPPASLFEGRLHPLTIAFGLLKAVRGIVPLAPVLLFGNKIHGFLLLLAISAGAVATALARYFSFSYRIEGAELITQHGILERKQRSIPLERIQEIRVEQGVLHRVFDVVDAKIETGGGEGAEASLSVLSRSEVERLRQGGFERAGKIKTDARTLEDRAAIETGSVVIRRLGLKDLILIGLTTNHLFSALALAGALWNFTEEHIPESFRRRAGNILYRESSRLFMQ